MTTAKICGLSTPETLDAALRHGASHVGFMIYPPSPRYVTFDRLRGLATQVPTHVERVGVFVDPDETLVEAAVAAGRLDVLQLHKTSPERAAAIRTRTGRKVWATVAVKTRADLTGAHGFTQAADLILYDAKTPDGGLPGGMGVRFDWGLLDGHRHPLPWALSGGLDAANVGEAIRRTRAAIVDVSSGVEHEPGVKDVDKIGMFLRAVADA
ncbi:phosphoribosylanthranilate isomerase [Sphingomonas sp. SUN019]|uniref:phosphoribosylanthranilate isomerase n=1 Tax=Sphingomonas sp. SUN019 TaxID=2937788 RepID=UPI002164381B|nr:phosphoribosylanthranilate isomerase [Sphingomonas sp. SUN019]UVO49300.1 phosphoribosylanthranilate isomerase [Sphingomonas sp. SUN019]